ncbi:MAG: hydrophobe/amphiphile efflux-3 (HAE3) family protein [Oleiphilaceae bacterium]|jgi:hydrophobe/amphiphile efflux-3 (HAE3) family protein
MKNSNQAYEEESGADKLARHFFLQIVNHSKLVVITMMILMASVLLFLPSLTKDTRSDAFLAEDNPALLYKNKVKEMFGLSDPMVIAVVNESEQGIYNADTLALVQWLSDELQNLDNINTDHLMSLATENNITGTDDGMAVTPFFENLPSTQEDILKLKNAIQNFPLYKGNLVAESGKATLIVAEIENEDHVEATYQAIQDIVSRAPVKGLDRIHIAGEGGVIGFLGQYIDSDAQRLNPLAGLIITIIIFIAFRRFSPAILGNVVIAASVLMTLGLMAASDVPFYVITNAMPVILIGISVADAIHIFNAYFERQIQTPHINKSSIVVDSMVEMWRPITLTTLTTAAGFLGLYFAAYMPPFKFFGLFTAIGVMIAGVYSIIFLPAAISIIKPKVHPKFIQNNQQEKHDVFSRVIVMIGEFTLRYSRSTIAIFTVLTLSGVYATSYLTVDENRIKTFDPSEPIFKADAVINRHLNGSNNIDIVVETKNAEGLFEPDVLRRMDELQRFAKTLPHVNGATSIVDYLKQINRSLTGGDIKNYQLPETKELVAQYFLIYSASGDPTDFEEEVDYDYQIANIRLTLDDGSFQGTKGVIESLQNYLDSEFKVQGLDATISGRVNVNYHWIKDLGESHFTGLGIALLLVWMVSALLLRSAMAGIYALIPVAGSILFVYSTMVLMGINLGIGTSMFASVAIGLGVDFAIHTIDRLKSLYQEQEGQEKTEHGNKEIKLIDVIKAFYPSTGRALFFNFLAISCGFGVLISSKVVPLNNFGTIVVLAVSMSFIASMTLLPAMVKVFRPKFILGTPEQNTNSVSWAKALGMVSVISMVGLLFVSLNSEAAELSDSKSTSTGLPNAEWVVDHVNQEEEGEYVSRRLDMTMTDKRGKSRTRSTIGYRKYIGDQKRTIIFYRKPSNVKGTGFMTYDYADVNKDDDQWLYLPALRKVRRISASDRGDYFLGTDFTYDDIKKEGKIEVSDFQYTLVEETEINSFKTYRLDGLPNSKEIAKELGYGRVSIWVDKNSWSIVKADYWDVKDKFLKTLLVNDIRKVDGIWTRHKMSIDNHKTGHHTVFEFSEVDYKTPVADSIFTKRSLSKGK